MIQIKDRVQVRQGKFGRVVMIEERRQDQVVEYHIRLDEGGMTVAVESDLEVVSA